MNWRAIWYLYEVVDGGQRGILLVGNPFSMIAGLPALGWCVWAGWKRGLKLGLKNVKLIPDGSGKFTRLMGMLIDKDHVGFGYRSWRYAMVVDDGKVAAWFEEPGLNDTGDDADPYGVSAPENVLEWVTAHPKG